MSMMVMTIAGCITNIIQLHKSISLHFWGHCWNLFIFLQSGTLLEGKYAKMHFFPLIDWLFFWLWVFGCGYEYTTLSQCQCHVHSTHYQLLITIRTFFRKQDGHCRKEWILCVHCIFYYNMSADRRFKNYRYVVFFF